MRSEFWRNSIFGAVELIKISHSQSWKRACGCGRRLWAQTSWPRPKAHFKIRKVCDADVRLSRAQLWVAHVYCHLLESPNGLLGPLGAEKFYTCLLLIFREIHCQPQRVWRWLWHINIKIVTHTNLQGLAMFH